MKTSPACGRRGSVNRPGFAGGCSGPRCMRFTARPGCNAAGCTTEGMTAIGPKECPKANVLNALPKSVQPKAKAHLKDICLLGHACPAS